MQSVTKRANAIAANKENSPEGGKRTRLQSRNAKAETAKAELEIAKKKGGRKKKALANENIENEEKPTENVTKKTPASGPKKTRKKQEVAEESPSATSTVSFAVEQISESANVQVRKRMNKFLDKKKECEKNAGDLEGDPKAGDKKTIEFFHCADRSTATGKDDVAISKSLSYNSSKSGIISIAKGKIFNEILNTGFKHLTVLQGQCTLTIGEASQDMKIGDFAIIPTGESYSIWNKDPDKIVEIYYVYFNGDCN